MNDEERWTETLRVDLTDEEVRARADDAARSYKDAAERSEELQAHSKEERGAIAKLQAEVGQALREVAERAAYRPVDVRKVRNDIGATMDTVRLDSGELVRSRPFTPDERQVGLFPQAVEEPEESSSPPRP